MPNCLSQIQSNDIAMPAAFCLITRIDDVRRSILMPHMVKYIYIYIYIYVCVCVYTPRDLRRTVTK